MSLKYVAFFKTLLHRYYNEQFVQYYYCYKIEYSMVQGWQDEYSQKQECNALS